MKKTQNVCSFCGRPQKEAGLLLQGLDGFICCDCAHRAIEIYREQMPVENRFKLEKVPTPQEIKDYLDQYVIGQDDAKKYLSVSVYNHYKRLLQNKEDSEVELEKSNIIMIGTTGTGKTLLARTIAKLLKVPFTIVDATVFTEAGYVGEDVESILSSLLKLLEGSMVNVPPKGGRKHPEQDYIHVDTRNILFICGGAFDGIEKKIAQRLNTHTVGYNSVQNKQRIDSKNLMKYVLPQDLKSFGLIPEIIGRLPVLTYLNPLDREALYNILTQPKNSLVKQQVKLFAMDQVELSFEEEALQYMVDKALEYKLGARGLRSIMESVMIDAQFDAPSRKGEKLVITKDYVKKQLEKNTQLYA